MSSPSSSSTSAPTRQPSLFPENVRSTFLISNPAINTNTPTPGFPTRYRSTSHGISAASGKIGSIIAQVLIGPLRTRGATPTNKSPWLNHVMEIYALFMLCGVFTTLLIPETKRKTLEQLAGEVPGTPEYDPRLAGRTSSFSRNDSADEEKAIGQKVHEDEQQTV